MEQAPDSPAVTGILPVAGTLRLESPDGAEVTVVPVTLRVLSSGGGEGSLSGNSLGCSGGRSVISLAGSLCLMWGLSLVYLPASEDPPISSWVQLLG